MGRMKRAVAPLGSRRYNKPYVAAGFTSEPIRVDVGHRFTLFVGTDAFDCVVEARCMFCGEAAIVALPAPLLAEQPDDTTHVCHPMFSGCNHGFHKERAL